MDELAQYRVAKGEKAVAIDLSILADDGMLAENKSLMEMVKSTGALIPIFAKDLDALLDYYCTPQLDLLTATQCQPVIGLEVPANITSRNLEPPPFIYLPTLRHLFQVSSNNVSSSNSNTQTTNLSVLFSTADSVAEAGRMVAKALIDRLSSTIAVPVEDIREDKAMHNYGIDSLVAIEVRNWFAKKVCADIAVFDILGNSSIKEVATLAAGRSEYRNKDWVGGD